MFKSMISGAVLAAALATVADAAILPAPVVNDGAAIVKVAEGCGAWWWRGPAGHCHPFYGPGGSLRGTPFACPPGMYIGPYGHRCWPI